MSAENEYDIAIVGCGMVGAAMALSLGNLDLRVAVVDRQRFDPRQAVFQRQPQHFDARVSALTPHSQAILQGIHVWGSVQALRHCPYTRMQVWDGEGTGSIQFDAAELGQRALGCIVENSVVLSALNEQLERQDNVTLLIPFSIDSLQREPRGTRLCSAEGQEIRARLLIGADGANSRVRELMGFKTKEWDYQHTAIVATVCTELPHQDTAWQRFMSSGPLAFLPLKQLDDSAQQHCSIVWSIVPERAAEIIQMGDDEFRQALGQAFEYRLGEIQWADKRFQLPLRQRHAVNYYQDNTVLIGDAAHTIHPLAGQGVNLGFLDAEALADVLTKGVAAGREINDPMLLARYQRQRKGNNLGMMWMMEGFKHLFAEQAPSVTWLRNAGLKTVDNLGLVKNQLARRAMGLN